MSSNLRLYRDLFGDIKTRIQTAQMRAMFSVNSERNIKRMLAFYRAYCNPDEFVPQAVAQISEPRLPSIEEIQAVNTGKRQLYNYLGFYRSYPQIVRTVSAQSDEPVSIVPVFVSHYQLQRPKQGEMEAFLRKAMAENLKFMVGGMGYEF